MPDAENETLHRLVVLDAANRVLVVNHTGSRRLPEPQFEDWPDLADLARGAADPGAVPCAPLRQIVLDGQRYLIHVLRASAQSTRTDNSFFAAAALDDLDEPAGIRAGVALIVAEQTGQAPIPEQRPDWWRRSWQGEVDTWVDAQLAALGRVRSGPSTAMKMWSLSAVLRIPTADGHPVYVKATCPLFAAEPVITQAISQLFAQWAPTVLAVEASRAWMLMEQLPGVPDQAGHPQEDPPPELAVPVAAVLAELQIGALPHLSQLRTAGCPDRTLDPMLAGLDQLVDDSIELPLLSARERAALHAIRPWAEDQLRTLADCGLPWTLAHGDLHLNNVAYDADRLVLYDWTDASLSHPFLDAIHLGRHGPGGPKEGQWRDAYLNPWRERCPDDDVDRAMRLAEVANLVFQATSYEAILRSQEPASRFELGGVIVGLLRKLLSAAPSGRYSTPTTRHISVVGGPVR